MIIEIDKENCTACGFCVRSLPEVFGFDEYGWAFVKTSANIDKVKREKLLEIINKCPGSCIILKDF